ncbi:MAG: aconitate hydratase AcnA [Alphaproteobacteria bacterium]
MNLTTTNFIEDIKSGSEVFEFVSLDRAQNELSFDISKIPYSYRVLLENLLRKIDDFGLTLKDIKNVINQKTGEEILFSPSRVLMQDYTGVPAVADLAAMREKLKQKGKNPDKINPIVPVSLVIDHSINVDSFSKKTSLNFNVKKEYDRNSERYKLLKWAQSSLENFHLFPPGSGICHQINLEFLAQVVQKKGKLLFFDSVVGTDSHTTMVNALSVLGWGVGGIEAEAVMLGQPISMQLPEVVGVNLFGKLQDGLTATDLVLNITEKLRELNVVGKFVEFYGEGLDNLNLSERSTISNMAPEYGATCGFFPIDKETLNYLHLTGRKGSQIDIVEKYAKKQFLWRDGLERIKYNKVLPIDLSKIQPCVSGPKRPQDKINLVNVNKKFIESLENIEKDIPRDANQLTHGKVCIAAITSCTNTSNPSVLIMAGLVAKKASELGLKVPWWVKTSFAPGSKVVNTYLKESNLLKYLENLGFNIIGYGCTTCIGNSGPLDNKVSDIIVKDDLNVCSVISGNRNFEGRIHPHIKSNFLASPPLVILYALAGRVDIDIENEPIQKIKGRNIFLNDLWPNSSEVNKILKQTIKREFYEKNYSTIFNGDKEWKKLEIKNSSTYDWSLTSTYIKKPPFLDSEENDIDENLEARPLLILGDSITTDHISPAGVIKENSTAGKYLSDRQIQVDEFNSYGSRRGNHEIMTRGTFANIRIKNKMVDRDGGFTKHYPSSCEGEVYEIAKKYGEENVPLVVIAGREYGTGSSRDWAAKGTKLLGVKAVLAESFERIHRSNLVGMGVLPLQILDKFEEKYEFMGEEVLYLGKFRDYLHSPNIKRDITIGKSDGEKFSLSVLSRIDTVNEINYFKSNGILPYVLNRI